MTDPFMPLLRIGLDPAPELGQWRTEKAVSKLEFPFGISAWLITGEDLVRTVLADSGSYSNDFARLTGAADGLTAPTPDPGGLGFADPPDHTRLRKLLTPAFTRHRLQALRPRIQQIVDGQLDLMEEAGGPLDLVQAFAMPIPSLVICELLGVPYEDREDFQRLSESRFDLFANLGDPMGAITESLQYLTELVQRQRVHPGDGMIGLLIRDHGETLSDQELAGLADGLLTGGHETTASMLALGTIALLQQPALAEMLRSGDDRTDAVVDELLRYLTVVQVAFPRFARQDLVLGGQRIAAGEMLLLSLSGADRDPALVPRPDTLDPAQATTAHLAFGYGIHRCVGAELAKLELRAAFPALLRRFPALELVDPVEDIEFRQYSLVHGVDTLTVRW